MPSILPEALGFAYFNFSQQPPEALVCEYLKFSQQRSRIFRCPPKMNIGYHKKLVGVVNDDRYGRGVKHVGRRRKTIVELAERAESMRCLEEAKEDLAAADTSTVTCRRHL